MPIHPSAIVDPTAEVDPTNEIGPNVRIGPNCVVGPGNIFMDGAFLGPNSVVGTGNTFHFRAIVGHDPQFLGFDPKTKSGTRIGNGNHFREFSTVHRGLKDGTFTVLGNENFLMAYSHLAHDCHVGNNVVLVNYAGISGHCILEDRCFISGHVAAHQFCRIGTMAMVGGRAAIVKDVPPYMMLKHYGVLVGVNVVGLRRAGVPAETRTAIRRAYKKLFREGLSIPRAVEELRGEYAGDKISPELEHLLTFCTSGSKRGISRGPRAGEHQHLDEEEE